MYKYLKRNRFSTQTSIIKNDAQQPVGMISKVYKNFIQKCIGYLTLGLKLNQYEICDVNNNSVAYIKVSRYMEKKHLKLNIMIQKVGSVKRYLISKVMVMRRRMEY